MDPWTVGLAVLVIVGLVVVVYGALADRAKHRRAVQEMLAPPPRSIPMFKPDAPAPHYLSELQARRRPTDAEPRELAEEDRAALRRRLEGSIDSVPAGYASKDFVTDRPTSWSVLDAPVVLVCAEPVLVLRELLGIMEKVIMTSRPLVVVAPGFGAEVISTLEVNAIQQTLRLVAVTAPDHKHLEAVAAATGAEVLSRSDLQSGYLGPRALGTCERWVSSAKASYILQTQEHAHRAS